MSATPTVQIAPATGAATINRAHLKEAVAIVRQKQGNAHLPTLKGVLIEFAVGQVKLTMHNLEHTITATIPANVRTPGSVLVDAKVLAEAVKSGADTVELELDDDQLLVRYDIGHASLRTLVTNDWPRPRTADDCGDTAHLSVWSAADRDTVLRVTRAAATEQARPMLTGVQFDGTHAVSTDSYRAHRGALSECPPEGTLVPAYTAELACKWKFDRSMMVLAGEGHVHFMGEHHTGPKKARRIMFVTLTTRQIEAAFPKVADLWPTAAGGRAVIDGKVLADTLGKFCELLSGQVNTPVTLRACDDGMELLAGGQNAAAKVVIPAEITGDFEEIALNPTYAKQAVEVAMGDEPSVELATQDTGLKPMTFAGTSDTLALLMPMRVN